MSKKIAEESQDAQVPFFAHLLSSQNDPAAGTGGPAPTYHCLDSPCTKKYPSDEDESTTGLGDRDW
ncbi:MAG: microviridin/marinostatin family tricyclic proteinase inhibitor [Myxococcales bacterium]|nr:microviridin/marinostatin family tricyclic proteinase inhibitor [Myxococcales bacterium]